MVAIDPIAFGFLARGLRSLLLSRDEVYVSVWSDVPEAEALDIATATLTYYLRSIGEAHTVRAVRAAAQHPERRVNPVGVPYWTVVLNIGHKHAATGPVSNAAGDAIVCSTCGGPVYAYSPDFDSAELRHGTAP